MEFISVVAAAIVSLAPRLSGEAADRYAGDIVAAVEDECGHSGADCIEFAIAMVVVQDAESSWRSDVESCRVTGDSGRSVSMWQVQRHWYGPYSRRQLCRSNALAAKRGAVALRTYATGTSYEAAVVRYMGCGWRDPRGNKRRNTLRRLKALPEVRAALAEEGSNEQS